MGMPGNLLISRIRSLPLGILDKLIAPKVVSPPRVPSVKEMQAIKLAQIMNTIGAAQTVKQTEFFKLRHLAGLTFFGAAAVPARLPVSLTRSSMRDIDPWWHAEPVLRHYSEEELTEDRRVARTDKYLVRTETRDMVLLDGQKIKAIRKIYYDKKLGLHSKELFARYESGKVVAYNQIPRNLMTLDGLESVLIAAEKDILVTEGYPAGEALRKRGIAAVAICSGTFELPSERALAPLLKAKHIVLWPDNDSAGAHLMSGVARLLNRMGARPEQIKLVFWKGGPRKGDAYDFTGSAEELNKLLAEAVTWSPEIRFSTSSIKTLAVQRISPQLRLDAGAQPPMPELLRETPLTFTETDVILSGLTRTLSNGQPLSDGKKGS